MGLEIRLKVLLQIRRPNGQVPSPTYSWERGKSHAFTVAACQTWITASSSHHVSARNLRMRPPAVEAFCMWRIKSRSILVAITLPLIVAACSAYHEAPMDDAAVNQRLAMPTDREIQAKADELKH